MSSSVCIGSGRLFRSMVSDAFVNCPVCKADSEALGMGGLMYRSAVGCVIPQHFDARLNLTQDEPTPNVTKK